MRLGMFVAGILLPVLMQPSSFYTAVVMCGVVSKALRQITRIHM